MIWCLHGAVGLAADWDDVAARLAADGHQVRAVDLWRYLECEALSLEQFGEAFCAEVAAVDDSPVLVGYSMGGRLALHALLARPALWSSAVIVSAHPGLPDEKARILRMASDAEWAGRALAGSWEEFWERWNAQPVLAGTGDPGERLRLRNRRRAVARSFMEWSLGKQRDLRGNLPAITCPLLWVTGEEDDKFTGIGSELAAEQPGIRHEVLAGAGHRVPWDAAETFGELVADWVER